MFNLTLFIVIPILTAIAVMVCRNGTQIRLAAFTGSVVQLLLSFLLLYYYTSERATGNMAQFLFTQRAIWYEALHIEYHVGVDGISIAMMMLTAIVVMAGILMSWKIQTLTKEFFFLVILLSLGAYGFFISLDLFTMFFFLELAVIPKYLLIILWGSGRKEYSAMKLALMLMAGSALILVGILAVYFHIGQERWVHTRDLAQIAVMQFPPDVQKFIFPFLFVGFGIFTALFPFYTWAPDGHSSAPTAASMFLAGISMKLGGYGCLRVAVYLLPQAASYYSWIIVLLAVIAIIYGSFATLMQKDLKYMNAYSSVSHCGFVLLGIGMLTRTAIMGAVMQMVSHGLMTALFFGAIGMIYERTHTRQIEELGGLLKVIPFIGVVYVIAGLCSLGLPGMSGFVSEMTIFTGSWQCTGMFNRVATILACASIVVTAVYILRAAGRAVMGPIGNEKYLQLPDASWSEKLASVMLIGTIVCIGMAPFWLTKLIDADTQTIMENILRNLRLS
ncbi:MAG: NADH-quinone oxidoreductase subunit M [Bacteroidia bacterium]|nr:NADH-quinone oxidoreductase subunit M [Bacteroidia bacterium]